MWLIAPRKIPQGVVQIKTFCSFSISLDNTHTKYVYLETQGSFLKAIVHSIAIHQYQFF